MSDSAGNETRSQSSSVDQQFTRSNPMLISFHERRQIYPLSQPKPASIGCIRLGVVPRVGETLIASVKSVCRRESCSAWSSRLFHARDIRFLLSWPYKIGKLMMYQDKLNPKMVFRI